MKEILLTQGKVTLVDDEDFEYLNQWKWYVKKYCQNSHNTFYAARVVIEEGKHRTIFMHREILELKAGERCDHEDQDGLNNQRYKATVGQNRANSKSTAISGYKGVYFDNKASTPRWLARIMTNKKFLYLGSFPTKEEAALAYNQAALKYHGEFAYLNLID
jgi:hypothetical protein